MGRNSSVLLPAWADRHCCPVGTVLRSLWKEAGDSAGVDQHDDHESAVGVLYEPLDGYCCSIARWSGKWECWDSVSVLLMLHRILFGTRLIR